MQHYARLGMATVNRRFLLSTGAIGLASAPLNWPFGNEVLMNANVDPPIVFAGLGDTLLQVRERSTYRFDFGRLRDDDLIAADTPVSFTFRGTQVIPLPPTRFVALNCTAAIVVAIEASPQLEYLPQSQVLDLADGMEKRIADANWSPWPSDFPLTGRSELALRLRDPATPEKMNWYLAVYAAGDARLYVRLRRVHREGRFADRDLFLLNLQWRDDRLADRADRIVTLLRNEDGVSPDNSRPIRLEDYVPRVLARLNEGR